ncbi:MAG: hypothetical protein AABY30_00665 [Candidatus Thermoplasmatota archaeon]
MVCPVCGLVDVASPCRRCGTDLHALAGDRGEARLEVVKVDGRRAESGTPSHG